MSKKIFYIQQQVELNQVIDFNGLKVKVTQELIDNNPNHFYIKDDRNDVLKAHFSKAVQNYSRVYDCNEVNPIQQCFTRLFDKHNRVIPEYVKCVDVDCNLELNNIYRVNKAKYTVSGNHTTTLHIWFQDQPNPFMFDNVTQFSKYFTPSTEEEYKQQEETKRLDNLLNEIKAKFPIGSKIKINDNIITVVNIKPHNVYDVSKDFISVFGSTTFYSHPVFGRYKVYDLTTNEYLALPYTVEDERLDNVKKKYKVGCEFEALTGQSIGQLTSKYQSVTIDKSDTITFDSYSNGNININIYPNSNLNHQYSFCIYNKQTNTWAKIIN